MTKFKNIMHMRSKKIIWGLTRITLVILSVLVFTPLVIPKGIFTPELFGLPYTLWVGMLVYFFYVLLILIGISVHSKIYREEDND